MAPKGGKAIGYGHVLVVWSVNSSIYSRNTISIARNQRSRTPFLSDVPKKQVVIPKYFGLKPRYGKDIPKFWFFRARFESCGGSACKWGNRPGFAEFSESGRATGMRRAAKW
ncbi:hypothetical protein [Parvibaculum sp. MBR-TMA-1.3b-4.2]|jgi:hypothetical protein